MARLNACLPQTPSGVADGSAQGSVGECVALGTTQQQRWRAPISLLEGVKQGGKAGRSHVCALSLFCCFAVLHTVPHHQLCLTIMKIYINCEQASTAPLVHTQTNPHTHAQMSSSSSNHHQSCHWSSNVDVDWQAGVQHDLAPGAQPSTTTAASQATDGFAHAPPQPNSSSKRARRMWEDKVRSV